ncbi:MAG: hypothetical protein K9H64_11270 [Bacteroidales bacterium]|nr:hypothetical protein [Bacteroidales bacterium]MCF8456531.1 hypothetical protein [Bacteroidales bacterium]
MDSENLEYKKQRFEECLLDDAGVPGFGLSMVKMFIHPVVIVFVEEKTRNIVVPHPNVREQAGMEYVVEMTAPVASLAIAQNR